MEDPVALLEALLGTRSDEVATALQAACAAVRKAAPEASEHIFATYVVGSVFTFTGKLGGAFCHPVAYANHVNLGFNRGTELEDSEGLLEGSGKLIRHIRIADASVLRTRGVKDLIAQAVAQGIALANQKHGIVPRVITSPEARAAKKAGQQVAKKAAKK
tara:strand:+ start:12905 stop:13384 length:480 start_codon:yes stop_codon:yes gene_type:complete